MAHTMNLPGRFSSDEDLLTHLICYSRSCARQLIAVAPASDELLIPLSAGELPPLNDDSEEENKYPRKEYEPRKGGDAIP